MTNPTPIPLPEILGRMQMTPAQNASDYAHGYRAGKTAGSKVAVGRRFIGGYGYANHYAGSSEACRESAAWKGACAGYLDGLPPHRSITVDSNGTIVSINP